MSCSAPQVVYASSPYLGGGISRDGRIGYATVAFSVPANLITPRASDALAAAAAPARHAGVQVAFGGGIVPQLGPLIDTSAFRARFEAKGRYAAYLRAIQTWVIHEASPPALRGAAEALNLPDAAG